MKTYSKDIKLRTFEFALNSLRICKKVAEKEKEFIITRQLARSATSVGANVREARNAVSKNDFIHKMAIAQKECDESMYWLELLSAFLETEYEELKILHKESNEILHVLSAIILSSRATPDWRKR
jgi:four helix bundle protein